MPLWFGIPPLWWITDYWLGNSNHGQDNRIQPVRQSQVYFSGSGGSGSFLSGVLICLHGSFNRIHDADHVVFQDKKNIRIRGIPWLGFSQKRKDILAGFLDVADELTSKKSIHFFRIEAVLFLFRHLCFDTLIVGKISVFHCTTPSFPKRSVGLHVSISVGQQSAEWNCAYYRHSAQACQQKK